MYSLYIPKYKNDKPEFLITKVVKQICKNICLYKQENSNYNFGLFMVPGYLSTTTSTVSSFVNQFPSQQQNQFNVTPYVDDIGIFDGMNGKKFVDYKNKDQHGTDIILSIHKKLFSNMGYHFIEFKTKQIVADHRKILFFFKYDRNDYAIPQTFGSCDIAEFMSKVEVEFLIIGSSNQSYTTYFGGCQTNSPSADKGEADVLFFHDKSFLDNLAESSKLAPNHHDYIPINQSIDQAVNNVFNDLTGGKSINHSNRVLGERACILSASNYIESPSGHKFGLLSNQDDVFFLNNILKDYLVCTLA